MYINEKEGDFLKKLDETKDFYSKDVNFDLEREKKNLIDETDKKISKIKDPLSLAKALLSTIIDFTKTERGFIMQLKEDGELEFLAGKDNRGNELKESNFKICKTIAKETLRTNKVVFIGNALNEEKFSPTRSVKDLKLETIICAPIVKNKRTIGVLYVDSSFPEFKFSEKDINIFKAFAEHISIYL
uniref:GAF domain-containing protein n=1 Tax=candidate division WOR-3 bacterium TaxID=2052148 RepID=A0A7C4UG88_UNCW3